MSYVQVEFPHLLTSNSSLFSLIKVDEHCLNNVAYLILEYHQYLLWGIKDVLMLPVAVGSFSVDFYFFLAMANSFFGTLVVILSLMV